MPSSGISYSDYNQRLRGADVSQTGVGNDRDLVVGPEKVRDQGVGTSSLLPIGPRGVKVHDYPRSGIPELIARERPLSEKLPPR